MNTISKTFRPTVEALEERLVQSATAILNINKDIVITGANVRDNVAVSNYTDWRGVKWYQVTENLTGDNKMIAVFQASKVTGGDVFFYGNAGNDTFANATHLRAIAYGGSGNDILWGGTNNDSLYGGTGNDWMAGMSGNDFLSGGTGADELHGSDGRDYLDGGDDGVYDYLNGGSDPDWFQVERIWDGRKYVNRDWAVSPESFDQYYNI